MKPNQYCTCTVNFGKCYWRNSNNNLHRVGENGLQDGPVVIYPDGSQFWCLKGEFHRLDGPAVIYPDGPKYWYLDGHHLTQEQWAQDPRVIEFHSRTQSEAEQWLKRL